MEKQTTPTQQLDPRCLSSGGYKLLQARKTGRRLPQRGGRREKPRRRGLPEPRAEAGARQHPRTCRQRPGGPRLLPARPGALTAGHAATAGPTIATGEHSAFRQRPTRSSPAKNGGDRDGRPRRNRPGGGGSWQWGISHPRPVLGDREEAAVEAVGDQHGLERRRRLFLRVGPAGRPRASPSPRRAAGRHLLTLPQLPPSASGSAPEAATGARRGQQSVGRVRGLIAAPVPGSPVQRSPAPESGARPAGAPLPLREPSRTQRPSALTPPIQE